MKQPKSPEEKILAAIADLAKRQSKLEIAMNEMICSHMENVRVIEALTRVLVEDDGTLDAEPIDTPSDLALDKWIADQRKGGGA